MSEDDGHTLLYGGILRVLFFFDSRRITTAFKSFGYRGDKYKGLDRNQFPNRFHTNINMNKHTTFH